MNFIIEKISRIKAYFDEIDRQAGAEYARRYKSVEAVAGFKYHRLDCTRVGPLEPISEPFMSVSGGGWSMPSYSTYVRCVECKGSERDRR